MRCVQCGAGLPEESRFCSHCGAKQPEAPADEFGGESEPGQTVRSSNSDTFRPEARSVPAPSEMGIGEPPSPRSLAEREIPAEPEAVPPPVSEPIAVRLTKADAAADAESTNRDGYRQAYRDDEADPPQMRPVSSPGESARFAPPSSAAQNRAVRENRPPERRNSGRRRVGVWIVPPLLAVCAAGALIGQVSYERGVSADAAGIQRTAADAALGGNYEIAESGLARALDKRPDDPGIRSDLKTVQTIRRLDDKLTQVQIHLGRAEVSEATRVLGEVEQELSALQGGAYDRLRARFDKLRERLELADIRSEAEASDTLAELGGLLDTASDYAEADRRPVIELISDRIVEIGGDEAQQAISSGSYYEAAAVVDEARSYVPEAERLIELEKEIASLANESDMAASELVVLSGAELTAGTGELRLTDFDQRVSATGLEFSGRLSNASSRPMYDLLVEFRAYDADGSFLGEDWTEVTPGVLNAGEDALLTEEVASAGAGTIVVIDSISWYRE